MYLVCRSHKMNFISVNIVIRDNKYRISTKCPKRVDEVHIYYLFKILISH